MAIAAMTGLMMTSCDDGKPKCWTISMKADGKTIMESTRWGTKEEIDIDLEESKREADKLGWTVSAKVNKSYGTQEDCEAAGW